MIPKFFFSFGYNGGKLDFGKGERDSFGKNGVEKGA
jgi:hypothetical protein